MNKSSFATIIGASLLSLLKGKGSKSLSSSKVIIYDKCEAVFETGDLWIPINKILLNYDTSTSDTYLDFISLSISILNKEELKRLIEEEFFKINEKLKVLITPEMRKLSKSSPNNQINEKLSIHFILYNQELPWDELLSWIAASPETFWTQDNGNHYISSYPFKIRMTYKGTLINGSEEQIFKYFHPDHLKMLFQNTIYKIAIELFDQQPDEQIRETFSDIIEIWENDPDGFNIVADSYEQWQEAYIVDSEGNESFLNPLKKEIKDWNKPILRRR